MSQMTKVGEYFTKDQSTPLETLFLLPKGKTIKGLSQSEWLALVRANPPRRETSCSLCGVDGLTWMEYRSGTYWVPTGLGVRKWVLVGVSPDGKFYHHICQAKLLSIG